VTRRGVWELSTPRLLQLLAALTRRRGEAVTAIGLQQDGFDLAICGRLAGLPAAAASLVVESVLAERTVRPRPELELVWTGREGGATLSRDTSQVLPQLFARAERRVIVAGFAFYEASNLFEPLHARARDAGVEVEFFIHVDGTGQDARMSPANFFTYSGRGAMSPPASTTTPVPTPPTPRPPCTPSASSSMIARSSSPPPTSPAAPSTTTSSSASSSAIRSSPPGSAASGTRW
jgi:hypothetical protein